MQSQSQLLIVKSACAICRQISFNLPVQSPLLQQEKNLSLKAACAVLSLQKLPANAITIKVKILNNQTKAVFHRLKTGCLSSNKVANVILIFTSIF